MTIFLVGYIVWASTAVTQRDTLEKESREHNMTSLSNPTVVVKVVDSRLGKGEIVDHGNHAVMVANIAEKGSVFTSRELSGYTTNTTLLCEIEITGKGSRKVRSVAPYDVSQAKHNTEAHTDAAPITEAHTVTDAAPQTPQPLSDATERATDNVPTPQRESVPVVAKTLSALDFSKWGDDAFHVAEESRKVFATAYRLLQRLPYKPVKLMMTGDSGFGKTTTVESFAHFVGLDFLRVNCGSMRDVTDWFGQIWVDNDNGVSVMRHISSEFADYLRRGNCVICLDEFNRVEANLHNSLFPLLDDSAKTTVNKLEFTVGPNVVFVGTVNLGYQHTGISEMDAAIMNRFDMILEVDALPFYTERDVLVRQTGIDTENAQLIVKIATALRENRVGSCSTRSTISIARMVASGLSIFDAFDTNVVRRIQPDNTGMLVRKSIVELIRTLISSVESA